LYFEHKLEKKKPKRECETLFKNSWRRQMTSVLFRLADRFLNFVNDKKVFHYNIQYVNVSAILLAKNTSSNIQQMIPGQPCQ